MAEKGEITVTFSTSNGESAELKVDVGETFQKVLPELTRPQRFLSEFTTAMKESREAIGVLLDLLEVFAKYREDLRTLLDFVKVLGESRKDLQTLLRTWRSSVSSKGG